MFFSVARLRPILSALILLAPLAPAAQARADSLFTSSVTYCAQPFSILVQKFDVEYLASNSSVYFDIQAASVEQNLNVSANLQLNIYGMHPFNFTIDLCGILKGALCPLPTYNFSGAEWLAIPPSVHISHEIPGIAYKIPDLEAFAQLTLTDVSTNDIVACVQSTLSNGWSAHQPAAEWSAGGTALLALATALWATARGTNSLAPARLLDLIYLYQTIAISGLLALDYPSVYRAYTLNFAWAMGLFNAVNGSSIQNSINNMRHKTGGNLADSSGSAIALVNRKLSPYNDPSGAFIVPETLLAKVGALPQVDLSSPAPSIVENVASDLVLRDVATVTSGSPNILQAGLPIWVNTIGISTANTFMSVFFSALILIAIALVMFAIGWAVLEVLVRTTKSERLAAARFGYPRFVKAWGLRVSLVIFPPVVVFAFYQWTLKDSWLSLVISVLFLITISASILFPVYKTIRRVRESSPASLFSHGLHLTSWAPLYTHFRLERWYFFIPTLAAIFLKALFVAFAPGSGPVQLGLMLAVELALAVTLIVLKPYQQKHSNVLTIYLAACRVFAMGLMIAFIESLGVSAIGRVAIGIVIAVAFSIAVIVMFFNTLVHLGLGDLYARLRSRTHRQLSDSGSSLAEKAELPPSVFYRPRNPTPDRNIPLDPALRVPYPQLTPTATSAPNSPGKSDAPSVYSSEGVTEVGTPPPRRQRFAPSSTSSESGYGSPLTDGMFSGATATSPRQSYLYSMPPSATASPRNSAVPSRSPTLDESHEPGFRYPTSPS